MVTTILLATTAALIWRGAVQLRRRAGDRAMTSIRVAASMAGLAVLALAVESPLADFAEQQLSAHMIQHALLMIVAPPLLLWGEAGSAAWWALPEGMQRAAIAGGLLRGTSRAWQTLSRPLVATSLYAVVFWVWHAPALYDWALDREAVHVAEHASFFAVGLVFWSSVMHRRSAAAYGVATLTLFATALQSGALGALLAMSSRIWYPHYADGSADAGARALADQQWAGLLMWIPLGLPFIAGGLVAIARCVTLSRRRAARFGPVTSPR